MLLNVSYWEWAGYMIGIVLAVLVSLPNGMLKRLEKILSSAHLHQKISSLEIKEGNLIQTQQGGVQQIPLPVTEITQLVTWFNEAQFIDKCTNPLPNPSLKLVLFGPEVHIEIFPYGNELVIHRREGREKEVSYWVLHAQLKYWFVDRQEEFNGYCSIHEQGNSASYQGRPCDEKNY